MNKRKSISNNDEYLWNVFRQGDHEAYETIFSENYSFLLNYGLKLITDKEEVKDCLQILFANLWNSRERLGNNTSIKNYLVASLRRLILRRKKKNVFNTPLENIELKFYLEPSFEAKHIEDQNEKKLVQRMQKIIDNLPDRQKEAIYLKYYGNHTFSEIANIMEINTRAVYKLIYKAMDKLNKQLADQQREFISLLSIIF